MRACAGVSHTGLLTDMTDEQWHRVLDVNLSGAFYAIRAFAPGMVTRREATTNSWACGHVRLDEACDT